HDRYFISNVADQIWSVEDGVVRVYQGSYAEYLTLREQGRYQLEVAEPAPVTATQRKKGKPGKKVTVVARPTMLIEWDEPIAAQVAEVAELEQSVQASIDRLAYPGARSLNELVTLAKEEREQAVGLAKATDTLIETFWRELRSNPLHQS
ncbi:MAG: ATP-binding cassette protein, partial [Chloroflexi bacterium]|nr:ATP-binding cassette protein [Chloroflexota bacterium]